MSARDAGCISGWDSFGRFVLPLQNLYYFPEVNSRGQGERRRVAEMFPMASPFSSKYTGCTKSQPPIGPITIHFSRENIIVNIGRSLLLITFIIS